LVGQVLVLGVWPIAGVVLLYVVGAVAAYIMGSSKDPVDPISWARSFAWNAIMGRSGLT
jgi:hypothetical protein